MKRSVSRKTVALLTATLMVITMMPSVAFAETWGDGNSDLEQKSTVIVDYEPGPKTDDEKGYTNPEKINTINYKEGSLKPFTFYNATSEIGSKDLDASGKRNLVKSQLPMWSQIAAKIYKSHSTNGGSGGLSGVTWDGPTWFKGDSWSAMFEDEQFTVDGTINLPDYLCKVDGNTNKSDAGSGTHLRYSGLQAATKLSDVRTAMIRAVAEDTNHDTKYFEERQKASYGKTLSLLDRAGNDDVFYSYVVHVSGQNDLVAARYYNCYGIAFYDFSYIPVEGDGLRYPNQMLKIGPTDPDNPDDKWTSYVENDSPDDVSKEVTMTESRSETQSNKTSETSGFTFGAEAGVTFTIGKKAWPVSVAIQGNGDFHKTLETTRETGKEVHWESGNESTVKDIIIPADSAVETINQTVDETSTVNYNCPVALRYKVSIFSLTGSIDLFGDVYSRGDFCTEFGAEGSVAANHDAVSNLYERAIKQAASEVDGTLARTEGYYKDVVHATSVDWQNMAFDEPVTVNWNTRLARDVIEEGATMIPMAEPGMTLTVRDTIAEQIMGSKIPLYYLAAFELSEGIKKEFTMREKSVYPLDGLTVVGKNSRKNLYCGFDEKKDQDLGYWEVAETDQQGNPLPTTGEVRIDTDDLLKQQKVEAKKEGVVWLKWKLKSRTDKGEKIEFIAKDEKTVSAEDNEPDYPYVKITVENVDTTPVKVEFDEGVPDTIDGIAGESLNLPVVMPVNVRNEYDEIIDHSCEYRLEDQSNPNASIDRYGNFIATEPGEYKIHALYDYVKSDGSGGSMLTGYKTIHVDEARKLTLKSGGGMGKVGPNEESLNLNGSVTYWDQYDDPWTGDEPELTYSLIGSEKYDNDPDKLSEEAWIQDDQLIVDGSNIGEGDTFWIVAAVEGDSDVESVQFDFAVEPYPMADIPEAIEGLVYNKGTQTGVGDGEGYTLEGEKAIDAGEYTATATLDKGYPYWKDGTSSPTREVKYSIDQATVKLPVVRELTYNGEKQIGVVPTPGCFVRSNVEVDAGAYWADAELQNRKNYRWEDGYDGSWKAIAWSIEKKAIVPEVTLSPESSVYDGTVKTPGVTVKDGTQKLTPEEDYTVTYAPGRVNAGTYDVSVSLKGNYSGEANKSFTIKKASNPLKVKGKTAKIKHTKLKKKTQKLGRSKVLSVSKAQGKVTYKKSGGNKKIKVDSKTGKVTVKKGLKKGTYKVKVKVNAAGNSNYNKVTKTVTFKVRVK